MQGIRYGVPVSGSGEIVVRRHSRLNIFRIYLIVVFNINIRMDCCLQALLSTIFQFAGNGFVEPGKCGKCCSGVALASDKL